MPCLLLIFITSTSQGGIAPLTWAGTVTAEADFGGSPLDSNTRTRSAGASYTNIFYFYELPHWNEAGAGVTISDGDVVHINGSQYAGGCGCYPNYLKPWGKSSIAGTLKIGTALDYPVGTEMYLDTYSPYGNNFSMTLDGFWTLSEGKYARAFKVGGCRVHAGDTVNLSYEAIEDDYFQGQSQDIYLELKAIPEPATLCLLALGGLSLLRKRRK